MVGCAMEITLTSSVLAEGQSDVVGDELVEYVKVYVPGVAATGSNIVPVTPAPVHTPNVEVVNGNRLTGISVIQSGLIVPVMVDGMYSSMAIVIEFVLEQVGVPMVYT